MHTLAVALVSAGAWLLRCAFAEAESCPLYPHEPNVEARRPSREWWRS